MSIIAKIRKARLEKGVTQQYVADKVGVKLRTIQRLENGQNVDHINKLDIIFDELGIEIFTPFEKKVDNVKTIIS